MFGRQIELLKIRRLVTRVPMGELTRMPDAAPNPAASKGFRPEGAALKSELARVSGSAVRIDAPLSAYSRWRIGGKADFVVEANSGPGVQACMAWLKANDIPVIIIGDGSNILFDDAGFRGVVVRIGREMGHFSISGARAFVEAGVFVPRFVRAVGAAGLSGIEHAIGIPGTMGGLIVMNGGSQRRGIGENLVSVRGCSMSGEPFELTQAECQFRYRGSVLQDSAAVVLDAVFAFTPGGDPVKIRREMMAIARERRRKFPHRYPNCGSVFVSNPAMYETVGPPGRAIEQVGLKGTWAGEAQISELHANFIVNRGRASSKDVLSLIKLARDKVHERTGFWMDCEVRHIGADGAIRPAHIVADEVL
jgi:UDP-N-acetylmuramate dehydrogenase